MDTATEQRIRAEAQRDFAMRKVEERLAEVGGSTQLTMPPAHITIPAAQVYNEIKVPPTSVENVVNVEAPVVHVSVDMTPLADVLREVFTGVLEMQHQLTEELREKNEMLSQLVQVLASQERPRVLVRVPEQPAPQVSVNVPARGREVEITHSDGTTSTLRVVA